MSGVGGWRGQAGPRPSFTSASPPPSSLPLGLTREVGARILSPFSHPCQGLPALAFTPLRSLSVQSPRHTGPDSGRPRACHGGILGWGRLPADPSLLLTAKGMPAPGT